MSNFTFLIGQDEYKLFANAAIEAEKVYATSPSMCAVGCRKALELAVKWVYSADNTIEKPYRDNLQSLIHESTFKFALDSKTWEKLPFIIKLGNLAVHTEKVIQANDVILSLKGLFEFIQWLDYCYGKNYQERSFQELAIPVQKVEIDTKKIKEQEALLFQQNSEIENLRKQIEKLSTQYTDEKAIHQEQRVFVSEDISEYTTRKVYIDVDLKTMGWQFTGENIDVTEEFPINDMMGIDGQKGYIDYVLWGKDGKPLAVIEAKKASKDPNSGLQQAKLYADSLERKYQRRPFIFTTNGFETYFWQDQKSPYRKVSSIFSKTDLQKLMNRQFTQKDLNSIEIADKITDRYYQKQAIRAVCDDLTKGIRRHLLVMATGTGKTRTASSLVDVLSRGNYITNVLFLADRTALVKQAKDDFKNYLPSMSLCNLLSNKDDKNARIVFSTYPTILNAIDETKTKDGSRLFTPAHFDLIIIDESHRSIFKKYKAIFAYFDAILVGLTATPKTDVARNTYEFFEMEDKVPTFAYDYETAVEKDHMLVPYYNIEVQTKFMEKGISYDELSKEEQERYENDFTEDDGKMPEFIESNKLNKWVFNQSTVDIILQDLMNNGIKINEGDCLGKTIIFAQNKKHAEYIVERFNKLYPQYKGEFARKVVCDDNYVQTIIDDFKNPNKNLQIAVSVDMLDTGIDVPECVNLVFFKKVRSKTKFWQMIGRGTRLCKGLELFDKKEGLYRDKKYFFIFDYCGNFAFFRKHINGFEAQETQTLSEKIFIKKIKLIRLLQTNDFIDKKYQYFRKSLVDECHQLIMNLNKDLITVKLNLRYVVKYQNINEFTYLAEDISELTKYIAPLITTEDNDEYAKKFDNFIYNMMLSIIEANSKNKLKKFKQEFYNITNQLLTKMTIPQIKEKQNLIQSIASYDFEMKDEIIVLEQLRKEIRSLIKFLVEEGQYKTIFTNLEDNIIHETKGLYVEPGYDFENYKLKVNRYIHEHNNILAVYKLTHNIPLTKVDYAELERILVEELGTKEDYKKEYADTPFGLLIRRISKMDRESVNIAFSKFINEQSLNQQQIAFMEKIIDYIIEFGYIDNVMDLMKPPFDRPFNFIKIFDIKKQMLIKQALENIKQNAIDIIA